MSKKFKLMSIFLAAVCSSSFININNIAMASEDTNIIINNQDLQGNDDDEIFTDNVESLDSSLNEVIWSPDHEWVRYEQCVINGIYFRLNQDGRTVSIYDADYNISGDLRLPDKIIGDQDEEYPVTNISRNAFYGCEHLTNITLPNDLRTIEYSAFYDCDKLRSMIIPESVTSIGEYAFCDCDNLAYIKLPVGITTIEYYTFGYCTSLNNVRIPKSVTSIQAYAFKACKSLSNISISKNVTNIDKNAFMDCDKLSDININ